MKRILSVAIALAFFLPAVQAIAKRGMGHVTGVVRVEGTPPRAKAIAVVGDDGPCGGDWSADVVRIWRTRVLDVTLWLTPKKSQVEPAEQLQQELNMNIWNCDFRPRLVVARPGDKVFIRNQDQATQWLLIEEPGKKKRQVMMNAGDPPIELTVHPEGDIKISNGFYAWMLGYIRPVPDIYSKILTNWNGSFAIENIPPGEYVIHAWHPGLGDTQKDIVVKPGVRTRVEVEYAVNRKVKPVVKASQLEVLQEQSAEEANFYKDPFKK